MTTLTPDQQRMLRGQGPCNVRLLGYPDTTEPPDFGGASNPRGFDQDHTWLEYDRSGIRIEVISCTCGQRDHTTSCARIHDVLVEATWSEVKAYARSLPYDLIARLRSCADRGQRLAFEEFHARYADGKAHQPRTVPESVRERFKTARQLIRDEEAQLLDEAFPHADAGPEPDLFDLLLEGGAQ